LDNQVENYLSDEQADRLANVLKTDSNKQVGLVLLFLLCTGARLREALDAEWKQVNRETGVWTIPATNSKSKKMIRRPLNDDTLAVLDALDSDGRSQFLFPSPATGRPYTTITRVWYRIRKAAGLPGNVRIHDLRHTFGSMVVRKGGTLLMAQHLLGHSDPRTTLRYAHMDMSTLRHASNAISIRTPASRPGSASPQLE
jgi:integrase